MNRIIIALLFCGLLLCGCGGCGGCGGRSEEIVSISTIKGQVQAMLKPAENFIAVQAGQKLSSGDTIKTGEEAEASLELIKDKSLISLSENSCLEIKNYSQNELQQISGTAIYKITPQNKELKIRTQHGVATVLGTIFRVDTDANKTSVVVEEGKVAFRRQAGTIDILIEPGMKFSTSFSEDKAEAIDPIERSELFDSGLKPIINPR